MRNALTHPQHQYSKTATVILHCTKRLEADQWRSEAKTCRNTKVKNGSTVIVSINDSTIPSVCYTVIYMVRVGLGLGQDGNVLSLTACHRDGLQKKKKIGAQNLPLPVKRPQKPIQQLSCCSLSRMSIVDERLATSQLRSRSRTSQSQGVNAIGVKVGLTRCFTGFRINCAQNQKMGVASTHAHLWVELIPEIALSCLLHSF